MAIHSVKERRATAKETLEYIYRGDGHEHDIHLIRHIGGNIMSRDPIRRCSKTGLPEEVDVSGLDGEFSAQSKLHKGSGEKLFKHYIISLAPGEELSQTEWFELARRYVSDLGYDESCKWVAVEHQDTDSRHIHIVTCLVKDDVGGTLVPTQGDAAKGFETMRWAEKHFGLKELESPTENWGIHYAKDDIKGFGGREEAKSCDWAAVIRARFKNMYEETGKPKTIKELVLGLAVRGVIVECKQNKQGQIIGISYRADDGPLISGSKVKATRLTWNNLQKREGIDYDPCRDDGYLGIVRATRKIKIGIEITEEEADEARATKSARVHKQLWKGQQRHYKSFDIFLPPKSKTEYNIRMMMQLIMLLFAALKNASKERRERGLAAHAKAQRRKGERQALIAEAERMLTKMRKEEKGIDILAADPPKLVMINDDAEFFCERREPLEPLFIGSSLTIEEVASLASNIESFEVSNSFEGDEPATSPAFAG